GRACSHCVVSSGSDASADMLVSFGSAGGSASMYGRGELRRLDVDHQPVRVAEEERAVAGRTRDAEPKLHHAFEVLHALDFHQPGVARLDVERAGVGGV